MVSTKQMKDTWYPRPHDHTIKVGYELDNAVIDATIIPISMYDEGLGSPSAYEANPRHASFVETPSANCFPESRIDHIYSHVRFSLTSKALDENLPAVQCFTMPIYTTFDDLLAIDELSTVEIQDVLEMQSEDTDNQAFPLFNATDMAEPFANSSLFGANTPGLDTGLKAEGVTFSIGQYYDNLHFLTTAGKLKVCQGGLKWHTLTARHPIITVPIRQPDKTKVMVEKSFFGILVGVPSVDNIFQTIHTTDITAATIYVNAEIRTRYNEWNQDFNMMRQ